uniref:Polymerase PB2 n=1 Tax=Jingshan Fly Virus 1 TaxID=1608053 RepID=A0A1L3KKF3_9ORTO|nr:polymerase PB2 [Jingshan Fly Virus 1]
MSCQTKLEQLCKEGSLYDEEFITRFGYTSPHWELSNWFQREASLRHDMVCLLLCNTEPYMKDDNMPDALDPPRKKRKMQEEIIESIASSSTTSSENTLGSDLTTEDTEDIANDSRFRYVLLEGRSNLVVIQNTICKNYGIEKLTRQYDIFDRKEAKFIEVKVTKNKERSFEEYQNYFDDKKSTCFFHIHPETQEITMVGKLDRMPGEGKAISFLLRRLSIMQISFNIQDTEIEYERDLIDEIFPCRRLNEMVEDWVKSFWKLRQMPLRKEDENPTFKKKVEKLKERELKNLIEDTTKRETDFIKFKAKLLPHVFTDYILTKEEEDSKILDDLFKECKFNEMEFQWILDKWNLKKDTFDFLRESEYKETPDMILDNLGIGRKKTVRYDNHEQLVQDEFGEPEKLRYSAWISNLLKDSTETDENELSYFQHLVEPEFESIHPMGSLSQKVINKLFQTFSETELAAYCSKVRNFYSRLGGAYLKRNVESNKRPAVVIFPLYSSGQKDGEKIRKVNGFCLRGPQHAKKPTDRIPFLTFELMGKSKRSLLYQQFIKKPRFITDSLGRKWCVRINSIMKQDPSYLTFVVNSTYLTANMIGEMTLTNASLLRSPTFEHDVIIYINTYREWFLERMAESVYMAVMGNSQEEGTLAAVRKIFMLKLNWSRGLPAWGSDLPGFAESLNECLLDQPLALYFAKQFRDILDEN